MKTRTLLTPTILPALILVLSACSQSVGLAPTPTSSTASSQANQPSFAQFQDIPIPPGARMNLDRTVILGAPASWIGRLALNANQNPAVVFDFFKQRTSEFGWQEVTTVRAATSFMTFTRANRVLNIQINAKTLQGSEVDLTISPRGQSGGAAASQLPQQGQ
ncbi:MAG: hypothetical protein CBD27_07425 [Rhodospirillaceae bacterium TMED167]|nr:hypothetical protein [Rhodospirillaceae bacterium]OUW26842.1 MAG: hypothetical protein CBD27_07425 [Rhodospirillaceae bacterium TMED167]